MKNFEFDNAQLVELSNEELIENNGGYWLDFWWGSVSYGWEPGHWDSVAYYS